MRFLLPMALTLFFVCSSVASCSDCEDSGDSETATDTDTDSDTDTDTDTDTGPPPPPEGCEGVLSFPDSDLEAAIRYAINKPEEDIYYDDVWQLTTLSAAFPGGYSVGDLTGIHCLNNLKELTLARYAEIEEAQEPAGSVMIQDLGPLSSLVNLEVLGLAGHWLKDLSPLENLVNLEYLGLAFNSVSDLSPLSGMEKLEWLTLWNNEVSDVTPLSSLTSLEILDLHQNDGISDISPLASLVNITELELKA